MPGLGLSLGPSLEHRLYLKCGLCRRNIKDDQKFSPMRVMPEEDYSLFLGICMALEICPRCRMVFNPARDPEFYEKELRRWEREQKRKKKKEGS